MREAIDKGVIGGRLWLYANYHCNLECVYCLTESSPVADRRELPLERLLELTGEARDLGFHSIGVTGGEPFLVAGLSSALHSLARVLPVLVLSNGTLFTARLVAKLEPMAGLDFAIQLSLDSATPDSNDAFRGRANFRKVVAAIVRLRAAGIRVRLATTTAGLTSTELARLCELHRSLGVPDEDHVVRPIIRRGRALERGLGESAGYRDFAPELTITSDGAFWSPFGPTVRAGRPDTDLLVTRTTTPLSVPAEALIRAATPSESVPDRSAGPLIR